MKSSPILLRSKFETTMLIDHMQVPEIKFINIRNNRHPFPKVVVPLDIESFVALEKSGYSARPPKFLYGVESYNKISFLILDRLNDAFRESQTALVEAGFGPAENLIAVFFHELVIVLCSYYFKTYEVAMAVNASNEATILFSGSGHPVYIGYAFLFGDRTSRSFSSLYRQSIKNRLLNLSKNLVINSPLFSSETRNGLPVSVLVSPNTPLDSRSLAKALRQAFSPKFVQLEFQSPQNTKIYLPQIEEQFKILRKHLVHMNEAISSASGTYYKQMDAIYIHIKAWIRYHLSTKRIAIPPYDILVSGTLTELQSRIEAAKAFAASIPVISVLHGDACGLHDEPFLGYGENSFAQTIVGYGLLGNKLATNGGFSSPLFGKPIQYVPSSSPKVRQLFRKKNIYHLAATKSPTYMYIPTSFSGDVRYGPYRDYHDLAYLEWQKSLLRTLRDLVDGHILMKAHPKNKSGYVAVNVSGVETVVEPYFENALTQADVYVIDYVSSAFSLAVATEKPIIYLDIGLRNLSKEALEALKQRCIYVEAEIRNPLPALQKSLSMTDKSCTNRISENFSLAPNDLSRAEVLAAAAHTIYEEQGFG